jgi:hypothetical protein
MPPKPALNKKSYVLNCSNQKLKVANAIIALTDTKLAI